MTEISMIVGDGGRAVNRIRSGERRRRRRRRPRAVRTIIDGDKNCKVRSAEPGRFFDNGFVKELETSGFVRALFGKVPAPPEEENEAARPAANRVGLPPPVARIISALRG